MITEQPTSKFLEIVCSKCKNEQMVFNKASRIVRCLVCDNVLAEPTGGMSKIKSKIIKVHG